MFFTRQVFEKKKNAFHLNNKQIRRINKHYSGGARLAELKLLLEQEISFLNKIERRRLDVHKTAEEMKKEQFLEQLGAPVKWTGYNSKINKSIS